MNRLWMALCCVLAGSGCLPATAKDKPITDIEKVRPKVFRTVHSTVVAEAARVMIVHAGLSIMPDTPESYLSKADLFTFLSALPMTYDETRILHGKIGEHICTARHSGDTWFIDSCCSEKGATLDLKLDFLKDGVTYEATLYEDAPDAHYINNKDAYRVRRQPVKKGHVIPAKLAPGGGHCVLLKPQP